MSTVKKNLTPTAWVDLGASPVTLSLSGTAAVLVYIGTAMPDATSRDGLTLDTSLPSLPINFPGQKVFVKAKYGPAVVNAFTTDAATSDVPLPGVVAELRIAGISASTVSLAWKAPVKGGAPTGYKVEYRRNSGSSPWQTFVENTSAVNCTVTGLQAGTTYRFRVTALNASGKGTASPAVYMQTAGYDTVVAPPADTTAPTITSPLTATIPENAAYSVTLTANEAVTFSKRTGPDAGHFTLTGAVLTMGAKDYEIPTDSDTNNTYICPLRATDAAGNVTDFSVTWTISDVAEATAPAAPTLSLTAGDGKITLAWVDGSNNGATITSHKLYRGTVSGTRTLIGTITTASPYVDSSLTNGTAYFYTLTAVNSAGESQNSAEKSATPVGAASQFPATKFGTYAYNADGSVAQMATWMYGSVAGAAPGYYGDAHIGRGASNGITTFTAAAADWVNSTDYVIQTCKWPAAGRELRLAMPLICRFGNLADAASGAYATYYTQIFTKIKNGLKPTQRVVRVRLGWEFNSIFQEWGTGNDSTKQANYVTAFRSAVDIARGMNDADFTFQFEWVMNPGSYPFIPCYPGDSYVDTIGMDCYPGLDYKSVYRAPEVISPQAQVAIWEFMRTRQYGMQDAMDFAKLRGKPFVIPEFAIEWNNGQACMDAVKAWCTTNNVESFGWWNDSDTNNVVSGISGILTTNSSGVVNGQKSEDIPNTGACIRNWFNPAGYPTQPQSPAVGMVNRMPTNLAAYAQSGAVNTTVVSGETDVDGRQVYKMAPNDTTTSSIKRITATAKCPLGVPSVCKVAVQADTTGFAILNGPAGTDTGLYIINLSTGALAYGTASKSGTSTEMAAKVTSAPTKRGNLWFFEITDKTYQTQVNPLLHMQPNSGGETAYIADSVTNGIKISRLEITTY